MVVIFIFLFDSKAQSEALMFRKWNVGAFLFLLKVLQSVPK